MSADGPMAWTDEGAWAGTRRPIGTATGLDPALYTDPAVHDLELDLVFGRSWVCVALTSELVRPGTVLARSIGARSIIVTRDAAGDVRSFVNSCRHRGTELVDADCTVRGTIRCPYHRWGYGLDGSLVSTPRFEADARAAADAGELGLVPVRTATWGCLVFACLDPRTAPLETWLGDLPARMAGYRLDEWSAADGTDVEIAANWKLISENFQEYYHLAWVHPSLAGVSRVDDHYRYQGPGMYCGQTTTPVSDGDGSTWLGMPPMTGLDDSDVASGRFVAIFPNVLLSVLPNHAFVMRLVPDGAGRTNEHCTWLVPPTRGDQLAADDLTTTDGFAAIRRFWLEVNDEDIDIVQRSQRGLATGTVPPGPLVARFEEPLHRFHNMLADHFTRSDPAEISVPLGDGPGADEALGGRRNPLPPAVDRA